MQHLDQFKATFAPVRIDDLKPGVAEWIGKPLLVQYVGNVDHQCEYIGQPRFDVLTPLAPMVWVSACDLADIKPAP